MDANQVVSQLQGGASFTKLFIRYESLLITTASWVIIQALKKSRLNWDKFPTFVRLEPFWPIVISVGMAFLPICRLGTWDETLLYGIVLGALTGFGTKVLKQTFLGQDARLQLDDAPQLPVVEPKPTLPPEPRHKRLREKVKHFIS